MASKWQLRHDSLFGPYRERVVLERGTCFVCGGDIGSRALGPDTCLERERGQTKWLVHVECHKGPYKHPPRRRK